MLTENVDYRLSAETRHLKRSVMRDLLKLTAVPDIISLAGGLPDTDLLPSRAFGEAVARVLESQGGNALQYRPQYQPLKTEIVSLMARRGVACREEQVFITNGNQQGLTILSRLFVDAGAPVVTEAVTFTGVQQATAGRGADVHTVPTDLDTGVDADALEAVFAAHHPRMAVIIPDFHNPLGVSISAEKRPHIAELAARYRVPVVEDDPYGFLNFPDAPLSSPIRAYDEDGFVFYLGSFSKILAPASRLGWLIAPESLIPTLTVIRESMDLESSALMQRAVCEFLASGDFDAHLTGLRAANAARCDAMQRALDEHLSDLATWTQPRGGLFVWVTLPENIDTWALFEEAVKRRVAYIPGGAFAVDGGHTNTMRLNFSAVSPEAIREGVARLAGVIQGAV